MSKKSHRIASRQAEVARERKRKKKAQSSDRRSAASESTTATGFEVATTAVKSEFSGSAVSTAPVKAARPDEARYRYVYRDLRTIGIIAAPLIVILIILAFVL